MSQKTVAFIVGRAAVDKEYLEKLKSNTDEIIAENLHDLTEVEIKSLKNLDHAELDTLHQSTTGSKLAAIINKNI
jgi:hypothetical protein